MESPEKHKGQDKARKIESAKGLAGRVRKAAEKHLPEWVYGLNEPKWQRWALILGTSLIAAFLMSPKAFRVYSLTLGEPAPETIIAPITYPVVDAAATSKNLDEVLKSVRPVYDFDDEMVHDVQARIVSAFTFMTEYLTAEAEYHAKEEDRSKETAQHGENAPGGTKIFRSLDDDTLRIRFENLIGTNIAPSNFMVLKANGFNSRVQTDLRSLVVPVLLKGVVQSRELLLRDGKEGILLSLKSKPKDKMVSVKDLGTFYDLAEAVDRINREEKDTLMDPGLSRAIRRLARDLINVNINYSREKSSTLKQDALAQAKESYFTVPKGEPIVKEGEPVNEGHLRKLEGLNKANPAYSSYVILVGFCLVLVLLLRLTFYFCEKHLDRSRQETEDLLLVCLLLLGTIVMVRFVYSLSPTIASSAHDINPRAILYAAPVATGPMLVALMADVKIAFLFSALAALTGSLTVEGDIYLFAFYFISGIVGLHGMTRITDRRSVLRAGLIVGFGNMLSILAIKMALGQLTAAKDFYELGLGFLGGLLSGLLVSGLAPLLEPLGYTTNIKLLELANLNHPLLRELSLEAPGTFNHSIMVGNLAEAAAELIGANPLLARVGAYYHDIGKVGKKTKPTYFIENQGRGLNPHDKLEPSMSALILVAHVKYGVEKAREHRLGTPIIDIIQQHHGSNLIKFFYVKALEKADKTHQAVSEDKYRYLGPRPQSKEAALVMLADVTEAASRTITDPTPSRIQKRVQTLIMGIFSEGQLDQSTLTLKDLHAITKSFVRALQGMLHSRIDYPGEVQEKVNGDSHRQQAEKDRNKSGRPAEENGTNIRRLGL